MIFSWFWRVLYRGYSSFFLERVYFSLLYPLLIFDMFIVVCVPKLEWFWVSLSIIFLLCACVCVCVRVSVCLCDFLCVGLCGFKFTGSSFPFSCLYVYTCLYMSVCIYIYIYICVCVCVCVCVCFQLDAFVWEHVWHKV